ncbi:hypothetical protein FA13DRAFT_1812305 [Coprinellus micaceus]|uniref:Uncharacterized protein n=1 Tax=Coprinellus micaceus TaxID=71717 RepID=A0A4Y7THN7_COPMI|nr:hypothetical protein FA13DRAFT_1812305 [Coprinellus micaceus]
MATLRVYKGSARLSTSFPYTKVNAIEKLDLPAIEHDHSAGGQSAASSCAGSEREGSQGIPAEEPCFVTRRVGYGLQNAHWANAVRGKENKLAKSTIELFLYLLGLVPLQFNLNSASNLSPLDPWLHYTLDKLGFFAITCDKPTLEAMLAVVKAENERYDQEGGDYSRNFIRSSPPFSNAQYEMVVLYPCHFLPDGAGLLIHEVHPDKSLRFVPRVYVKGHDGALRESHESDAPRLPPFSSTPRRELQHNLNPFLVVLNAEMVFRRFNRTPALLVSLCPEYQELINLTTELADCLYYDPLVKAAMARMDLKLFGGSSGGDEPGDDDDDGAGDADEEETDEFGPKGDEKLGTVKAKGRGGTGAVKRPRSAEYVDSVVSPLGPDEQLDFLKHMIFGRDVPLTEQDMTTRRELGLHDGDDDEDDDVGGCVGTGGIPLPRGLPSIAEKVLPWQSAICV